MEQTFINLCRKKLSPEYLNDVFILTYDKMRRYEGKWHVEKWPVFSGYIFLDSIDSEKLNEALECDEEIRQFTDKNQTIIPIPAQTEKMLKEICDIHYHSKLSKGYIQNGCTYITDGPLLGKESMIRRIDRHKRLAELKLGSSGKMQNIFLGLEIVSKQ